MTVDELLEAIAKHNEEVRKGTAKEILKKLKKQFKNSREYYTIDTGTAWDDGQIGGLINDKIDKIAKEYGVEL